MLGDVAVQSQEARQGRWDMVIDLARCVTCKACTIACKQENKTPPGLLYQVVLEQEQGTYPAVRRLFFPRPCMHCEHPLCLEACPVQAIKKRPDGIVYIDYDVCEGYQACIAACPYDVPKFDDGQNYIDELSPFNDIPSPEYFGKFGRREPEKPPIGKARKCTFCLHLQDADGHYLSPPACATTCMGRAIHFGDLGGDGKCIVHGCDLSALLQQHKWTRLKEELGSGPSVYYLLPEPVEGRGIATSQKEEV